MNIEQNERMQCAITHMMLHHEWWASLFLHLRRIETTSVPTMGTDGSILAWNPNFVATLTEIEIEAVLMHETAHCALLHSLRREARDPERWNIACDACVNAMLLADGIILPDGCVSPATLGDLAEEIYDKIVIQKIFMQDVFGPGELGGDNKNSSEATPFQEMTISDWKQAVASLRGIEPKGMHRIISSSHQPKHDWKSELAVWTSSAIKSSDRTWNRVSRRYSPAPGRKRDPQTKIAICVDTSGSIDENLLSSFFCEMKGICATSGVEAYIIACDAAVHAIYLPGEEWSDLPGGRGTDFRPAIAKAEELEVDGIVYFTDGYGEYGKESAFPVLWAMSTFITAPWGHTIRIGE